MPDTREKAAFLAGKLLWIASGCKLMETATSRDLTDLFAFAFIRTVGSKIYMHGVVKPYQTVLRDLWILDTETWTWRRGPDGPGPRADHTLLQYHDYIIAVSGEF